MNPYELTEEEKQSFKDGLYRLQQIWLANESFFKDQANMAGIRSTQVMSVLAIEIIKNRK